MADIDFKKLAAPFDPIDIHWRVGSTNKDKTKAMALAYIDARALYNRLDAVCGPENWQVRYPLLDGEKTVCEIGIRVGDEWLWKSNIAGDTDIEGAKGGASDALKRAGVPWGIGRYLYALKSPWVAIEPYGRSYKICEGEYEKLSRLLTSTGTIRQNTAPKWACDVPQTELKKQLGALSKDIAACSDLDSLIALQTSAKETIKNCQVHLPSWYHGDGGSVKGLLKTLQEKHEELEKLEFGNG